MEQLGRALGDMYSSDSRYVLSANGKGAPGQALTWITSTMMRATMILATWKGCAIAATQERPGGITAKNHQNEKHANRAPTLTHAAAVKD